MFVDRENELTFLNDLLTRSYPGPAQLVLLYGRRRVGKSELLLHWAEQSGVKYSYWEAIKESATMQRSHLFARLLGVPPGSAPIFNSWVDLWESAVKVLGTERQMIILDELPYAADADPAFLSALQYAWDQYFQRSQAVIVLCGSHVRTMQTLLSMQSPLFGRMTAQWHLQPLPFSALAEFFPKWDADERVAAYAVAGGIPAYLNWLDPELDLENNIRKVILNPGGMFLAEPNFLLYDEIRELSHYLAVLKAIGAGAHTLDEIRAQCFLPTTSANAYLATLQELHLVERRLPATVHSSVRARSRSGRYHLSDPYFRFYFRFLAPHLDNPPVKPDQVLITIRSNLRAFVGATSFEDLARQWVLKQAESGQLTFQPETLGSYWDRKVQVDVVALNWQTHDILLGECKWGLDRVDRKVVQELTEDKTPLVLKDLPDKGVGWKVQHALFGRSGFTPTAKVEMDKIAGFLVDLKALDRLLRHA
jgi:AAA+ ATPase superfamily predicted ATPase